jgi:hypothetical protein
MDLAEKTIEKMVKSLWASKPIREQVSPREIFASDDLDLKDVRGIEKSLKAVVRGKPNGNLKPTAGGDFLSISPRSGIIAMYLNSDWTPEALEAEKYQIISRFGTILVHEVTHALDVLSQDMHYVDPEGDLDAYYNQPAEFRAYSKEIVTEAMRYLPRFKRKYRGKVPSMSKVVEDLLHSSPIFLKVAPHFNRSNQNRLRQMLVREVQDSGVL